MLSNAKTLVGKAPIVEERPTYKRDSTTLVRPYVRAESEYEPLDQSQVVVALEEQPTKRQKVINLEGGVKKVEIEENVVEQKLCYQYLHLQGS